VRATNGLASLDGVDQPGYPEPTASAQGDDPAVHQRFVELAVTQTGVECHGELLGRLGTGEVDQRACWTQTRNVAHPAPIDQVEALGVVDPVSDAPHVAIAHDGDVERRLEPVPVEAVERCGRGTARHHVAADVEHQRTQIGERARRSTGEGGTCRCRLRGGNRSRLGSEAVRW